MFNLFHIIRSIVRKYLIKEVKYLLRWISFAFFQSLKMQFFQVGEFGEIIFKYFGKCLNFDGFIFWEFIHHCLFKFLIRR